MNDNAAKEFYDKHKNSRKFKDMNRVFELSMNKQRTHNEDIELFERVKLFNEDYENKKENK